MAAASYFRCVCFNLILLLLFSKPAVPFSIIKSLPGFSGSLPFKLETGWVYHYVLLWYLWKIHLQNQRKILNVCKQIHRGGWEGRCAILLLLYRIWRESQRGSPYALAHRWPWLLCYLWTYFWDRLLFISVLYLYNEKYHPIYIYINSSFLHPDRDLLQLSPAAPLSVG